MTPQNTPRLWLVYVLLVATNVIWGSTWVVGKLLVAQVPPITASALRFLIASVLLAAVLWWREGGIPRLPRRDWPIVLALGATGIFLYAVCFLIGLRFTSAGRGALIIALNPAVTALGAWWVFRESMSPMKASGIALALAGSVWVISHGDPWHLLAGQVGWGELLIVGCVLMWAMYSLIARFASGTISALAMNFYSCLAGAVLLTMVSSTESPWLVVPHLSLYAWLEIAYLAAFATVMSYTWYLHAVGVLGAGRAAVFTNITPISGVLMGAWLMGERLPASVLLGGAVTIFGVLVALSAKHSPPSKPKSSP